MLQSENGKLFPEPLVGLPIAFLLRTFLLPSDIDGYRNFMSRYQQITASMSGPPPKSFVEVKKQIDTAEQELGSRRAGLFTGLMAPALSSVMKSQVKGRALHRAAEVLVAATRARLSTGEIPDELSALVSAQLPAVPRDPFTADQPLLAKRSNDTLVVYSVGPDGEDDGGPPAADAEKKADNDDVGLRLAL
jgi:hypothetical protein